MRAILILGVLAALAVLAYARVSDPLRDCVFRDEGVQTVCELNGKRLPCLRINDLLRCG